MNPESPINGINPPWISVAGNHADVATVHFLPANGLPADSYGAFFDAFGGRLQISSTDNRSCWPNEPLPERSFDWHDHANDLIGILESQYQRPVIGMGHSIGGTVTLLAAIKRPDLFSRLVIIDPATSPSKLSHFFLQHSPLWLTLKVMGFIRGSHNRRYRFASRQQFKDRYRSHPTFARFTDRAFEDYMKHGLVADGASGFKLLCHPHWESHNFRRVAYLWSHLSGVSHPTLMLRAEHSYMYDATTFRDHCDSAGSNIEYQQIDQAHHLATHELPQTVADQVLRWLDK